MSTGRSRKLGGVEQMLVQIRRKRSVGAAAVIEVRGAIDTGAMRLALDGLQRRHAILRAGQRGMELVVDDDCRPIPLRVLERAGPHHAFELAEAAINNSPIDDAGPRLTITCLVDPGSADAEMVVAYDHAAMDGLAMGYLLDVVLDAGGGADRQDDETARPLLDSIGRLAPPALRGWRGVPGSARFMLGQAASELRCRTSARHHRLPISDATQAKVLMRRLDPEATRALTREARRRRTTMSSVALAALTLVIGRTRYEGGPVTLRTMQAVDLRSRAIPRLDSDDLGANFVLFPGVAHLEPGDDLWTVSRLVGDEGRAAVRRGDPFRAARVAGHLTRVVLAQRRHRVAHVAVSYGGSLGLAETHGQLEVTGVHSFVAAPEQGPEFSAFATLWNGQLSWDFMYLQPDWSPGAAGRVADDVCDLLEQAVRSP